jgi:CubicO group peptidase (beta-lactamase class C family)
MPDGIRVEGENAARFARVRAAFEKNFASGEVGAALAVTLDGELVVDLFGGHRDAARSKPWQRGALDLDAPVASYWPEFAPESCAGSTAARWARTSATSWRRRSGSTSTPAWDRSSTRASPT